jgi:DNA-binding MarR family transcriptional regulator
MQPGSAEQGVERKIVAALERLAQALRVLLWEEAKAYGASPIQLQILLYLQHAPPARCRVRALAQEFDLTPPTISDAVASLAAKGLLQRAPWPADRRGTVLQPTPAGRELASALTRWTDAVQAALATFSAEEKLVALGFLLRLIAALQQAGVITVARLCLTCRFFQPNVYPDPQAPHHCGLLDRPLPLAALRVDCPDHVPAPPGAPAPAAEGPP